MSFGTSLCPRPASQVARFWLLHAGRVAQAHPTAAAGCWQQIATAAAETYGHIAGTGLAAARLPWQQPAGTGSQQGPGQQQRQVQLARDLDGFVASKLAGLLAVGLDQPTVSKATCICRAGAHEWRERVD